MTELIAALIAALKGPVGQTIALALVDVVAPLAHRAMQANPTMTIEELRAKLKADVADVDADADAYLHENQ